MTHVRTSPYRPQSNGKIERWTWTIMSNAIRRSQPSTLEGAREVVSGFVAYYNPVRLYSSLGYITPAAMLEGREVEIWRERDRNLKAARERRSQRRNLAFNLCWPAYGPVPESLARCLTYQQPWAISR